MIAEGRMAPRHAGGAGNSIQKRLPLPNSVKLSRTNLDIYRRFIAHLQQSGK